MKIKVFITFAFTLLATNIFSQKKLPIDNNLLDQIINLKDFELQFYICKNQFDTLIVIDSTYSFNSFTSTKSCSKEIIVQRINNYYPNRNNGKEPKNLIAIYNLDWRKRYFLIDLWQPYSGGTLRLKITKKQSGFSIKVNGKGAF